MPLHWLNKMEKQVLFSIITVVYNDADNLEKSVISLIGQSCKDFEFIVIDGGSTDRTTEIIRKYQGHITFWVSEKDKGIYDAMNKGIKAAKGEFLHFLNAGDTYSGPGLLQMVAKKYHKFPSMEVFYGKTIYKGEGSHNIKGKEVNYRNVYFSIPFCHQSMFFKRSLFEENGLYDTSYKYAADYAWMCKYLRGRDSLGNLGYIDQPVSVYLDGGASFLNMEKVIEERKRIAKNYFPSHIYYVFIAFSPFLQVKNLLLKLMVRLRIINHYRRAKHRLKLSVSSNQH